MQLSNRMGRGGSSSSISQNYPDDLEISRVVHNPLQPNTPSSAYLESQKRARDESLSNPDRNPVNHRVRPGLRTIASAFMLFVGGLILLIIGTAKFTNRNDNTGSQGLEMLVIGSVSKFPFKAIATDSVYLILILFF